MTGDAVGIIRLHRAEDDADAILRRRVAVLLEIAEAEVLRAGPAPAAAPRRTAVPGPVLGVRAGRSS